MRWADMRRPLARAAVTGTGEGIVAEFSFWVFSNPTEGSEVEFNAWSDQHVRDVVRVPGFRAAQRFRLFNVGRGDVSHAYLNIYEMDATTVEAATAALAALSGSGLSRSDVARCDDVLALLLEPCSPKVDNSTAKPSGDFIFVSANNPVPGREAQYNAWYNDRHVAEVVGVEGFTTGQRMAVRKAVLGRPAHGYLAVYRMDADSHESAGLAMQRGADAGLSHSDDIAKGGISMLLQACSPRVTAAQAGAPA
jgi:hypothetical protein